MELKPIETAYKGYRFRSRLEARWAVFFDHIGLHWDYEAEGFHLPSGPYLPDFFIRENQMYVEVKPTFAEVCKTTLPRELAIKNRCTVMVVWGDPMEYGSTVTFGQTEETRLLMRFAECRRCPMEIWLASEDAYGPLVDSDTCTSERYPLVDSPLIVDAGRAARSARFEHGEKPVDRDDTVTRRYPLPL